MKEIHMAKYLDGSVATAFTDITITSPNPTNFPAHCAEFAKKKEKKPITYMPTAVA
jgi:hypothetical protein